MQVILMQRIERLGQMGDVVNVRPGYARNYLLPKGKALRATKANQERFESDRVQLEAQNLKRREEAEAVAASVQGTMIGLIRQAGENGQLYGSVNARDVAEGLTEAGFTVERQQIRIQRAIKSLGIHTVRVMLHPEVTVDIRANVAQSGDAADLQAQAAARGEAAVITDEAMAEAVFEAELDAAAAEAEAAAEATAAAAAAKTPAAEETPA